MLPSFPPSFSTHPHSGKQGSPIPGHSQCTFWFPWGQEELCLAHWWISSDWHIVGTQQTFELMSNIQCRICYGEISVLGRWTFLNIYISKSTLIKFLVVGAFRAYEQPQKSREDVGRNWHLVTPTVRGVVCCSALYMLPYEAAITILLPRWGGIPTWYMVDGRARIWLDSQGHVLLVPPTVTIPVEFAHQHSPSFQMLSRKHIFRGFTTKFVFQWCPDKFHLFRGLTA